MAERTKLSVEKALEKLRGSDQLKSKDQRLDEKVDTSNEEIRRMRAQRLRLEMNSVYHDSAAALLVDGKLVAAVDEQLFNRINHGLDNSSSWALTRSCCRYSAVPH